MYKGKAKPWASRKERGCGRERDNLTILGLSRLPNVASVRFAKREHGIQTAKALVALPINEQGTGDVMSGAKQQHAMLVMRPPQPQPKAEIIIGSREAKAPKVVSLSKNSLVQRLRSLASLLPAKSAGVAAKRNVTGYSWVLIVGSISAKSRTLKTGVLAPPRARRRNISYPIGT